LGAVAGFDVGNERIRRRVGSREGGPYSDDANRAAARRMLFCKGFMMILRFFYVKY